MAAGSPVEAVAVAAVTSVVMVVTAVIRPPEGAAVIARGRVA